MSSKIALLTTAGLLAISMLACSLPGLGAAGMPTAVSTPLGEAQLAIIPSATHTTAPMSTAAPSETPIPPTATATATATETPTATPTATATPTVTNTPIPCNLAKMVADVTYPDNTEVTANTTFTKTWRLMNVGSCPWTADYKLVFISGESMGAAGETQLANYTIEPNHTVDASIALKAPGSAGTYQGHFKLRAPDGTPFGIGANGANTFWVQIVVVEPTKEPTVAPTVPPLARNMAMGMQGDDVKQLQTRLLALGYSEVGAADGKFGQKTDNAVRHFQTDKSLTVDGIVGKNTWEALWK
jgi:hypothetical protein